MQHAPGVDVEGHVGARRKLSERLRRQRHAADEAPDAAAQRRASGFVQEVAHAEARRGHRRVRRRAAVDANAEIELQPLGHVPQVAQTAAAVDLVRVERTRLAELDEPRQPAVGIGDADALVGDRSFHRSAADAAVDRDRVIAACRQARALPCRRHALARARYVDFREPVLFPAVGRQDRVSAALRRETRSVAADADADREQVARRQHQPRGDAAKRVPHADVRDRAFRTQRAQC